MERRVLYSVIVLTLLTSSAILAVSLVGANESAAKISEALIDATVDQTDAQLDGFFNPVNGAIRTVRNLGQAGMLDPSDPEAGNRIFIPLLQQYPQITSMMIATDAGEEYMLLEGPDGWTNRVSTPEGAVVETRDSSGALIERTSTDLDYDPRERPWFTGAMASENDAIHWTKPYNFFTTGDAGITASMQFRPKGSEVDHVIAFDLKLIDISRFTTSLEISRRGEVAVLSEGGQVIGLPPLPRFEEEAQIREAALYRVDQLGDAPLEQALETEGGQDLEAPPSLFESGGEFYWADLRPYELGPGRRLQIAVLVPETDFTESVDRVRNRILGVSALALGLAFLLGLGLERWMKRRLERVAKEARRVGQYTLREKLGEGGMGAVYRAEHAMLRRPTAVKLMLPGKEQSESAIKRFEKEVQLTSQLAHPNTIAIYDFGRTPQGIFYYAMEYLDGVTLQDLVTRTGPLPPARVIFILDQICGSLGEAHEAGMIHRDIKPANIMLSARSGFYDWVKVLDFGLVKEVGEASEAGLALTGESDITGTPHYISPEALLDPKSIDARSDLYAVGAVGYMLLTGETVFRGRTVMETLTSHLSADPEPPSARAGVELPDDLERVILDCLAKEPTSRPASARELQKRLAVCADAGGWTQEDAARWWAAHEANFSWLDDEGPEVIEETAKTQLAVDLDAR